MIYRCFKIIMGVVLRIFFRKVYFCQSHLLPPDKALVLACNHPNSFLDAILLAVLIARPIHFLARGDVFNSPWKRWFLRKIHVLPVYRREEGIGDLGKNEDTFIQCTEILKKNGVVLIFSEGNCVLEKRLRPLRKGTARLALQAAASLDFQLDLRVVPVSLNYTHPTQFRREVMISLNTPLTVASWQSEYRESPARAIRTLTAAIRESLLENLVLVADPQNDARAEAVLAAFRLSSRAFRRGPWLSSETGHLEGEIARARNLDQVKDLFRAGHPVEEKQMTAGAGLGHWLTYPVYLAGFFFNFLPFFFSSMLVSRKVKMPEFRGSVLMVLGWVFYSVYLLFLSLVFLKIFGLPGLLYLSVVPVLGYLALLHRDQQVFRQDLRNHQFPI